MRRKTVLLAVFLLFAGAGWLLAEDITLTTYYPSPRGVYNQLRVNSIMVGDVTLDPDQTVKVTGTVPPINLWVEDTDIAGQWVSLGINSESPATIDLAVGGVPLNINGGASAGHTYLNAQEGRVGIRNSNPRQELHVTGDLRLTSSSSEIQFDETNTTDQNWEIEHNNGDLRFRTCNDNFGGCSTEVFFADSGRVGIGTTSPDGTLDVDGTIYQRGSVIHASYVFEPDFELESIEEHAAFMWKEKHLLAVGKGEVDEEGKAIIEIGSHQMGLLEELEKAHIYIEQLHERLEAVEVKLSDSMEDFRAEE